LEEDRVRLEDELDYYGPHVRKIDLAVNALALFHVIYGVLAIITISVLININIYENPIIVTLIILANTTALIIALPLFIILGWGIWSLQPWAWKVAVIANIVYLILTLLGSIVLLTILNIIFILILYSTDIEFALTSEDS
jgi:hypothetical protein